MKSFLSGLSLLFMIPFVVNSQTVKLKSSEGYIQTNDSVRLFYRLIGEGKDTMVVFHGGGFGSSYLVPDLTPLAAHHALLFLTNPAQAFQLLLEIQQD